MVPIWALFEVFLQWRIPRWEPTEDDWHAAVRAVEAEKQPGDLVVIAPDWAVQGRMYFEKLISWKDFGRFDTRAYRRIFEVSGGGASAPETDDLSPDSVRTFGKLTVARFDRGEPDKILYDFRDHLKKATLGRFIDKHPKIIIDHWFQPRYVIGTRLSAPTEMTFREVPMRGVLRVVAFIDYREGRYDKGAPARLTVYVNDKQVEQRRVANFDPLRPLEIPLSGDGTGTVKFEVSAPDNKRRELGLFADVRIKETP